MQKNKQIKNAHPAAQRTQLDRRRTHRHRNPKEIKKETHLFAFGLLISGKNLRAHAKPNVHACSPVEDILICPLWVVITGKDLNLFPIESLNNQFETAI